MSTTQRAGIFVNNTKIAEDITTSASYQYELLDMAHRAMYCVALEAGATHSVYYTLHSGPSSDGPWKEVKAETSIDAAGEVVEEGFGFGEYLRIGVKQNSGSDTVTLTAFGK